MPGDLTAGQLGLIATTFLATAVEVVEAFTIVLAMGITRGWRSALAGAGAALVVLAAVVLLAGQALVDSFPESILKLVVGSLLLVFGLQWLRKSILRSAGRKALHDEERIFAEQRDHARAAGSISWLGIDGFGFVVAFKGVFLEGLEVAFIVLTFGLSAGSIPLAAIGAVVAALLTTAIGVAARRPLANVPENTIKFAVGLLLTTFGTYWAVQGLGLARSGESGVAWPGGDIALPLVGVGWALFSWLLVRWLRAPAAVSRSAGSEA